VGFKGFPDTLEGKAMLKQQSNFDQGFGKRVSIMVEKVHK